MFSPEVGLLSAGGKQIVCDGVAKKGFKIGCSECKEGKVFLLFGGESFVYGAVEVRRERGQRHNEIACKAFGDERSLSFANDASGKAERAVEKGVPEPAAVRFRVQPRIIPVRKGGVFL